MLDNFVENLLNTGLEVVKILRTKNPKLLLSYLYALAKLSHLYN